MGDDFDASLMAEIVAIGERLRRREVLDLYRAYRVSAEVADEAMGGRFVYAQVDASTVAEEVRQTAQEALEWAVADQLMSYMPAVVWFAPETDGDRDYVGRFGARDWRYITSRKRLRGQCQPPHPEVWLNATLSPADACRTAAHECRHLDRPDQGEWAVLDYEDRAERKIHGSV